MVMKRLLAFALILAGTAVGWFVYNSQITPDSNYPFRLGLDLTGGTHLVYEADTSSIPESTVGSRDTEVREAMDALRDVIERRIRAEAFGASEPLVQVEGASIFSESENNERLIVELPGVTDVGEATRLIGETPLLEFKLVADATATATDARYVDTGLTGRMLTRASVTWEQGAAGAVTNTPVVVVNFNSEGTQLFSDITTEHTGEQLAIFLDGSVLSEPVINEPITGGSAVISGNFAAEEAKELVRNLNIGALPVPIHLIATQSIGPSLGAETVEKGVKAGILGLIIVGLFMVVWYRLPGFIAVLSLALYVGVMLALFKVIPVTLTAAGVAGFILSIGMAVDANVLIFERLKEELRAGKPIAEAIRIGFSRAWLSIRDGNASSILTAIILFWFGTSVVEGFALTFGLGVLVSMLTAITVTRTLLLAVAPQGDGGRGRVLFGAGFTK